MTTPTRTFRDLLRMVSPPWLQTGSAEKLLYAIGAQLDVFGDALVAGVKLRFPGLYSGESLGLIGRERRISRGLTETDDVYGGRLRGWLDGHRRRGGPYALLQQLHAFHAPNTFPVQLLYRTGRRYSMDANGDITRDDVVFYPYSGWAYWWLVMEAAAYTPPLTAQQIADIALIPTEWNAAHAIGYAVVMPPGGELWDYPPGHVWDESGTWDTPDVVTTIPIP